MATEKITDRWLKSKVELGPEEEVLRRGYFWYRVSWWLWTQGRLYLTTDRLIWVRNDFPLPAGPRLVELDLSDMRRCERSRPQPFSLARSLLVEAGDSQTHWFSPLPFVEDLDAWSETISRAMGYTKSE